MRKKELQKAYDLLGCPDEMGKKARVKYSEPRSFDINEIALDITKAKKFLVGSLLFQLRKALSYIINGLKLQKE